MSIIYDANDVAKYIIYYESTKGRTVSNLRLQKLLYFVQAQMLVNSKEHKPCFVDRMEAWDFGPVVPSVYREYRYYTGAVIPYCGGHVPYILSDDKKLIDSMLDACEGHTNTDLLNITHAQEPWQKAYRNMFNNEITPDSIYCYFVGGV